MAALAEQPAQAAAHKKAQKVSMELPMDAADESAAAMAETVEAAIRSLEAAEERSSNPIAAQARIAAMVRAEIAMSGI